MKTMKCLSLNYDMPMILKNQAVAMIKNNTAEVKEFFVYHDIWRNREHTYLHETFTQNSVNYLRTYAFMIINNMIHTTTSDSECLLVTLAKWLGLEDLAEELENELH